MIDTIFYLSLLYHSSITPLSLPITKLQNVYFIYTNHTAYIQTGKLKT